MLVYAFPATAEFYRYEDAHGNTIYTDDYSKVPPDQREGVDIYNESYSRPTTNADEKALEKTGEENDAANENTEDNSQRARLQNQEQALAKEFDELTAERNTLDKVKKTAVSKSQIKEYNKKVVEFNARIKAYEEKRDAHTIEVNKFNESMLEKESNKSSQ